MQRGGFVIMKKTVIIQASKNGLYINIPKSVVKQMDIEKGETAIIDVIDKDTMLVKIIEE